MTMFARFGSRLVAHGLLLLGFLIWWLTNRGVSWRDRLLCRRGGDRGLGRRAASGRSVDQRLGSFLGGVPIRLHRLGGIVVRDSAPFAGARRVAVCAAILLVLGYYTLIRSNGIDGAQRGEFSWRWSPTSEELFLASHTAPTEVAKTSIREWTLQPGDWPEFRGVDRDGILAGVKLVPDWNGNPPQQVWRQRVGPGWSSMIVVDGHLVTQEQRERIGSRRVLRRRDRARKFGRMRTRCDSSRAFGRGAARDAHIRRRPHLCRSAARGFSIASTRPPAKLLWSHDLVADAGAVGAAVGLFRLAAGRRRQR